MDNTAITLGQLKVRLPVGKTDPSKFAEAMVAAIVDALVLREFAVLDIVPRTGEPRGKAVDRLLAEVFSPLHHCGGVGARDLKLAYMSQLSRFKHPASWTLWTAITRDPVLAQKLATALKKRLPPPPSLPAELTCTGANSPVIDSHAEPFEQAVAELAGETTAVQLRRYTFYDQHDEKIPPGHFRATEPAVADAVRGLQIGAWSGPIEAVDGLHVALVVCRDRRRFIPFGDPSVLPELRGLLCQHAASTAQQEHIERLMKGATVTYKRTLLIREFGAAALVKLPASPSKKENLVLPD